MASHLKARVFGDDTKRKQCGVSHDGLNAYKRHKKLVNDYLQFYGGGVRGGAHGSQPVKTDHDVLRESYRFIRSDADDAQATWEQRLAKRYYDKLFKEYCLADMSRYKESKIGLRWRTQKEVLAGKGQFVCGAKGCEERAALHSFELNFGYVEAGRRKQALVKLRVCPKHSSQLNFRKEAELQQRQRDEERERRRRKRRKGAAEDSSRGGSGDEEGQRGVEPHEAPNSFGLPRPLEARGGEEAQRRAGPTPDGTASARGGKDDFEPLDGRGRSASAAGDEASLGRGKEGVEAVVKQQLKGESMAGAVDAGAQCRDSQEMPRQSEIWAGKAPTTELTRDEEFDEFFKDLLM